MAALNFQKSMHEKITDPVVADQAGREMQIDPLGSNAPVEQQIRLRAYQIFEQRGKTEGHALDDWLEAEQQVDRC